VRVCLGIVVPIVLPKSSQQLAMCECVCVCMCNHVRVVYSVQDLESSWI